MTNEQVKKQSELYIKLWTRVLRLEDYDITVQVPNNDPGFCAQIGYNIQNQRANIIVRNPDMHPPDSSADSDLEISIVHELLHLRMPVRERPDDYEDRFFEAGIERIAKAFVSMRRVIADYEEQAHQKAKVPAKKNKAK